MLCRIESAKQTAPILETVLNEKQLSRLDRAFMTELVYGVLRQQGYLDWVLGQRTERPFSRLSPRLRNLLRLGAYQILFLTKVPVSASVNESVKLARTMGDKPVAGFVNAVLRDIARRRTFHFPDPETDPVGHVATHYSHPPWIVKRWIDRYGLSRAIHLCQANNAAAPLTIRANRLFTAREDLRKALKVEGIRSESCAVAPEGLHLTISESERLLSTLESYRRGAFYVQDEAAQLVSLIVGPKPHERVLDTCAAPGGKTTHMAELMGNRGKIVALDINEGRLRRLRQNTRRLGLTIVEPVLLDATQDITDLGIASFDRILVDAPCSGLGLLRRNPEGKWKKTEDLIRHYAFLQRKILHQVSPVLKPGGVLVYSTCTTEPEENEQVVDAFGKAHPSFERENLRQILPETAAGLITETGIFNTVLNSFQMDSFFAVRMVKKS